MAERTKVRASTAQPREDLLDLFEDLRRNGYNVGTQQYVAAQKLLVKLAAEGGWLDHPERLTTLFAPIVCTTPEEQENFPRFYERWLGTRPSLFVAKKGRPDAPADERPRRVAEPERKPPRTWNRWWLLLLAVPPLLLAVILVPLNSPSPPTQLTLHGRIINRDGRPALPMVTVYGSGNSIRNLSYPDVGQFTFDYSSDDLPLGLRYLAEGESRYDYLITIQKPTTSVTLRLTGDSSMESPTEPTTLERLWQFYRRSARRTIGLVGALLVCVVLLSLSRYARRLELRKWRTRSRVKTDQLVVKGAAEQLSHILSLRRTAQELRRHRPSAAQDLDVSRTIDETIRRGLFTPTYAVRKSLPEYLVLIDRINFDDQQARFVDEAMKRLAHNDVYIERYFFQGDPRVFTKNEAPARRHSLASRLSSKDELNSQNVTLQELATRYPNHNLIVFSDGVGLFNPLTGRAHDWLAMFSPWSARVFLTSEFQTDDYKEWALTKSGFLVLPADRVGLAVVGELTQTGPRLKGGGGRARPLPRLLRQRPTRWLEEHPPAPPDLHELCAELKEFLGGEGYSWLSACAVYPMLYWDLTLYLGYRLVSRNRFDEKLTTLLRLPWFRHGSMPDWLREHLIIELPREQELAIRGALKDLLLTSIRKPEGFVLPIVRDPAQGHPRAWRRAWGRLAQRITGWRDTSFLLDYFKSGRLDSPLRDHVLLSFIAGRKPDRLALRLPQELYAAFVPKPTAADVRIFRASVIFITLFGLSLLAAIAIAAGLGDLVISAGVIAAWAALHIHALWQVTYPRQEVFSLSATNFYRSAAPVDDDEPERRRATWKPARPWSFVLGRPVRTNEKLYGRDELLADVAEHLRKFTPVNIVGERRSGKTSVLNHLQAMYEGRDIATADYHPLLIRIDFQEIGSDVRRFYALVLRKLAKVLSKPGTADRGPGLQLLLEGLSSRLRDDHHADEFRSTLEAIIKDYPFFKLVIVVDEFEAILAPSAADGLPEFFAQLRSMMSAELMTMVIASVRPLYEHSTDGTISDSLTSPFANYFTTLRLKPLDDAEAEALLRGVSDDQLTDGEIAEARRWAGGIPCLLQVAAATWYESKRGNHPQEWAYIRREELKLQNCASAPSPTAPTDTEARPSTAPLPSRPVTSFLRRIPGIAGDTVKSLYDGFFDPDDDESTRTGPLPTWSTLWQIFVKPARVFVSFRVKPRFLLAAVIILALAPLWLNLLYQRAGFENVLRAQFESFRSTIPPEQIDQTIQAQSGTGFRLFQTVLTAISQFITFLIGAGLYFLGARALSPKTYHPGTPLPTERITFKQTLSVYIYSSFAQVAISTLGNIVYLYLLPAEDIPARINNNIGLFSLSLAVLVSSRATPVAASVLSTFDLLALYGLTLAALGLHKVGNISWRRCWLIVLTIWLISTAIRIGFVVQFSS